MVYYDGRTRAGRSGTTKPDLETHREVCLELDCYAFADSVLVDETEHEEKVIAMRQRIREARDRGDWEEYDRLRAVPQFVGAGYKRRHDDNDIEMTAGGYDPRKRRNTND